MRAKPPSRASPATSSRALARWTQSCQRTRQITAPFTTLDYELYGPWASVLTLDPEPGAYDLFNGALVEFDDAYNTLASLAFTTDAVISPTDLLSVADAALDDGSLTDAALFAEFFNTGVSDVVAYFTTIAAG